MGDTGKTGTQLFNELASDKRFLMYMDEPGANVGNPRFEGSLDDRGSFPQTQQYQGYTFEPLNEPLPSLKRMRFSINGNYLKLVDRRNEQAQPWTSEQIKGNIQQFLNMQMNPNMGFVPFNPNQQPVVNRFGYHSVGHLIVVNTGHVVVWRSMPRRHRACCGKSTCWATIRSTGRLTCTTPTRKCWRSSTARPTRA